LKLLPYFDVPLDGKSEKSKQIRMLLNMAKSEGDMITKIKSINTLTKLISIYFDRLSTPGFFDGVVADMTPCFYHSTQKS